MTDKSPTFFSIRLDPGVKEKFRHRSWNTDRRSMSKSVENWITAYAEGRLTIQE